MDKEIQEIREAHAKEENFLLKYPTSSTRKAHEYISYLLQQIDQVGEIRESLDVLKQQMIEIRNYTAKLKKQIEIKDKALEFYADRENYEGQLTEGWATEVQILKEGGELARAALKGEDTP